MSDERDSPISAIIDLPFIVVDATMGSLLEQLTRLKWHWRPLTSGSSRHMLRGEDKKVVLIYSLYAIDTDRTEILIESPMAMVEGGPQRLREVLDRMHKFIENDVHKRRAGQLTDTLQDLIDVFPPTVPRQRTTSHEPPAKDAPIEEWLDWQEAELHRGRTTRSVGFPSLARQSGYSVDQFKRASKKRRTENRTEKH